MRKKLLYTLSILPVFFLPGTASAQLPPDLQAAAGFALFSNSGITNTGNSQIRGNIAYNSGASTGFGNVNGQLHNGDSLYLQGKKGIDTVYSMLNSLACGNTVSGSLGSQTLTPDVYCISGAASLSGTLTLNAQGNQDAIFIFKVSGNLSSSQASSIVLANGAQACRVFWKVEGTVTLDTNTVFKGSIISNGAITLRSGAGIEGRVIARSSSVSLNSSTVMVPLGCGMPVLRGPYPPNFNFGICYSIFTSSGSVTNTGISSVVGDIGTNNGSVTGFNPLLIRGAIHSPPDSSTAQIALDLSSAYNYLNGLNYDIDLPLPAQLGKNLILTPHVYRLNGNTTLTDSITLDALGNPDAVFVFQVNGTFTAAAGSKIKLAGLAKASNVFWKVEGNTDLNGSAIFKGTLLVHSGTITASTGANVEGRTFTISGAINTSSVSISLPGGYGPCGGPTTNTAPLAVNDTVVIPKNSTILVNVTANDSDPNGDSLTVSINIQPARGSAIVVGKAIRYVSNSGYVGRDSLQYRICDNGNPLLCSTAWVIILVGPNRRPIAVNDTVTTPKNTAISVNVSANDTDYDADPLVVSILTGPKNGSAAIVSNNIRYTPANGFSGKDSVKYMICDNGIPVYCDSAWLYINVVNNRPPDAVNDTVTVLKNIATNINVLANDNDPDGDALTVSLLTSPKKGSAVISGNMVRYTPNSNFTGNDSLLYKICDNGTPSLCDSAWVFINVVSNRPPIARDDSVLTLRNLTTIINVIANDSDPDGDSLTVSIILGPKKGTAFVGLNRVVYTPELGYLGKDSLLYRICDNRAPIMCDSAWVRITVVNNRSPIAVNDTVNALKNTPLSIDVTANDSDPDADQLTVSIARNPSNGTASLNGKMVVYTPATNFTGRDSLMYRICDNGIPIACDSAWVIISVLNNRPPMAVDDYVATLKNTQLVINVTANDSDPDGDALTVSMLASPKNGSAVLSGNNFTYTPGSGFTGKDSLFYKICDTGIPVMCDSAWVHITVVDNRPPVAVNDTVTTLKNTMIAVDVTANDSDPDGDPLTVSLIGTPQHGTAVVSGNKVQYTPASNYTGIDSVRYRVCDNRAVSLCDSAWIFINTASNRPPVAVDDTIVALKNTPVIINVTLNDRDPDGDQLTVAILTGPKNGNAVLSGNNIVYTPNTNYLGSDSIMYRICDNGNPVMCDAARVMIEVVNNRRPVANNDTVTTPKNIPVTIAVTNNDTDPDGDALKVSVITGPVHGTYTLVGQAVRYTPTPGFIGSDSLQYRICDDGSPVMCDDAWVFISVIFTGNRQPVALDDAASVCINLGPISIDVQSNDNDPDFDQLTTGILSQPSHGTVAVNGKAITYTPAGDFSGKDTFTYYVCDNGIPSLCANARVVVTVHPLPSGLGTSNQTICKGSSVTLGSPPVPGNTYQWTPDSGLSSAGIANPVASPAATTMYRLVATSGTTGCRDTGTVIVIVNPRPAAVTGPPQTILTGKSVTLGAPPVSGHSYQWAPAEGLSATDISQPRATPTTSTLYVLTEKDTVTGCTASNEVLVKLVPVEFFNAFSPNEDGSNDFWNIPVLELYPENEVIIVNRWGSEVWRTTNYNNSGNYWTGKNKNGVDLPDGTYYYVIRYNNEQKEGWVLIKR